ncbi:DnaJ domain-containing protein [Mycena rebaudengoi]|nr:DnaJ domain-containing protein [Mycena rebaudengoi]
MTAYRRGTHYETLDIRPDATKDQVKDAFFALSKTHHPDIPGHKVNPEFHEITEAYNVLRDPISRRAYDNTLPARQAHAPSSMHSRHMADTAARFRRASRPGSSSSFRYPSRAHSSQPPDPPFPRRPSSQTHIPGAGDRHNRHPGQRYTPPDRTAQSAAWAEQQRHLRDRKTRGPKIMGSLVLALGGLITLGWLINA